VIKDITITHTDNNGDTVSAEHSTDDTGRSVLSLSSADSVWFTPMQWRQFKERVDGLFEPRDFPRPGRYNDEEPPF